MVSGDFVKESDKTGHRKAHEEAATASPDAEDDELKSEVAAERKRVIREHYAERERLHREMLRGDAEAVRRRIVENAKRAKEQ